MAQRSSRTAARERRADEVHLAGSRPSRDPVRMKAVILAAGEGRRLHPLTSITPKPLLPVANRRILDLHLDRLAALGVEDVHINLHHKPDAFEGVLGSRAVAGGPRIHARVEPFLRGPAGSLLTFEDRLSGDETILVLSGDGVYDFDLRALMSRHAASGAELTVALKETVNGANFGNAVLDADGFVGAFVEKPTIDSAEPALVSCGVYCVEPSLLQRFPVDEPYDFGEHLIPEMVARREPVTGFEVSGYWCDIGTPATLWRTNLDAVEGRVAVPFAGERRGAAWVHPEADIAGSAAIDGPVVIGRGATIGRDTVVRGPAVIGDDARVGDGCFVADSVLLSHSRVPTGSSLFGSLVANSAPAAP